MDVKVIVDDDELTIDLSGVNDQVSGPFNSGREAGAVSVGRMAAKFLFSSATPVNEGDFERVKIEIPDGKFLSAGPGAAYGSAGNTHASVVDTILSAFSEALPDRIPAGHHGIYGTHTITGITRRRVRVFFALMRCQAGGVPFPIPTGRDPTVLRLHGDVRDVPVEI